MNAGGGNDFWESGALRPDLILQDLRKIFSPSASADRLELNYFIRLQ
jgi:iron complex transport system substrate-binding protein